MGAVCCGDKSGDVKPGVPSFKIVLLGEPEVGKTSIFNRFLKNQFNYEYRPTVDVCIESSVKKVNVPDNNVVSVTVWDLPGRDDIDLRRTYYRNLDAAVVVVDISDNESIELAASWKQEVVNNATVTVTTKEEDSEGRIRIKVAHELAEQGSIPILLLGNKLDVVEEQFVKDKVERLAKKAQEEGKKEVGDPLEKPFDEQVYSWDLDSLPGTYRKPGEEIVLDSTHKGFSSPQKQELEDEETMTNEEEDNQPEIVKRFLELGQQHGFITSYPVSAKANDGSVASAMQTLIRHLLEKHTGKAPPKKEEEAPTVVRLYKKKTRKEKDPVKLDPVGVEQLDDLYARCYLPMKMNDSFTRSYKSLLKSFRKHCVEALLVQDHENSLSHCISSIKEEIGTDYELKVKEDDHFLTITVEKTRQLADDLKPNITKCIDALTKYCDVCRAITREVPGAKTFLTKLDTMLEDRAEDTATSWEADGKDEQELRKLANAVEDHNAKIDAAIKQMQENLDMVMNTKNRIKNALMW